MEKLTKKLAKARVMFQQANVKMSGKNSFAEYKYYELSDILPVTNKINEELGILTIISFTADLATCDVVDSESGDKITFTSPMSTAQLKGCHDVQNLGAVQTYIKRYLYQNVYEITESDALNATQGKPETETKPKPKPEPKEENDYKAQLKELIDNSKGKITGTMIAETMERKFSKRKANELNLEQFKALVKDLQEQVR
ncbi:MAG: hypothetical protein GXX85_05235 [Ignavibacteria bacterium]|nr:hypothetical protein [Ignavibacteria bacterium]